MTKNLNIKYIKFFIQVFLSAIFLSCTTTDSVSRKDFEIINERISWEQISNDKENATEYFCFQSKNLIYHIVKLDLNNKNLKINAYPKVENQTKTRLNTFQKESDSKIIINTTPFSKKGKLLGIHIVDGKKLSSEIKRYSAVYFEKDNNGFIAKISENQKEKDFENAIFAFGGFFTILKDGEIQEFKHTSFDSRSAIGISKDGKTIFLLTVEKNWNSTGLSYPECAEILKKIGAINAIEFDGGSSTSLFIKEKNLKIEEFFIKKAAFLGFNFD